MAKESSTEKSVEVSTNDASKGTIEVEFIEDVQWGASLIKKGQKMRVSLKAYEQLKDKVKQ